MWGLILFFSKIPIMDYLQLQQELVYLSMDNSAQYAVESTMNRACIDWGFEQLFWEAIEDEDVRKYAATNIPEQFFNVNQQITLPGDFFRMYKCSLFDFSDDPWLDYLAEFFEYEIVYNNSTGLYMMQLSNTTTPSSLYIRYIPQLTPMVSDTDSPTASVPFQLQRIIAEYALARYYRYHRDMANFASQIQIAQDRLTHFKMSQ